MNFISPNSFTRPSADLPLTLSLPDFVKVLESHEGLIVLEGVSYDNVLYCGTDNLYFSYCFNYNSGKAIAETLLIVDEAIQYYSSSLTFVIRSQGYEYTVYLKE